MRAASTLRRPIARGRAGHQRAVLLLALPTYVIILGLAVIPLILLVSWSFWRYDPATFWMKPDLSLDAYATILTSGRLEVMMKTGRIALTTTVLALLLSYPIAYFLHRLAGDRLRTLLSLLFLVPFFTSYIVRTFAWRLILGRVGLVNTILLAAGVIQRPLEWLLFSDFAVQVGLLASYLPFMIFPILLSMIRIHGSTVEASSDLGASGWQTLRHVVIPLTLPGIFAGCLFVFVMALGSSVEVQFLGGAAESMIAIMITDVMRVLNFPLAFAISTMVLAVLLAMLVIGNRYLGLSGLFRSLSR
ncbi:MAG TPA: ABC transporter permease [bacterium]|nr:ABC transporter permease [bacterium]